MKRVLLVGNGINMALSRSKKDIDKYSNLINQYLEDFYELIGINTVEFFHYEDSSLDYWSLYHEFIEYCNGPATSELNKKYYNYYLMYKEHAYKDIETIIQMFATSKRYENMILSEKERIDDFISKTRGDISRDLATAGNVQFTKKIIEKFKKFDHIFTTNYDYNFEFNDIHNVTHLHGDIKNPETIDMITFKASDKIEKLFNDIIGNEECTIEIFGISLHNEIHILKSIRKLYSINKKIIIKQYIYSNNDKEFNEQKISNILNRFYFCKSIGDKIKYQVIGSYTPNRIWTVSDLSKTNFKCEEVDVEVLQILFGEMYNDGTNAKKSFCNFMSFLSIINYYPNTEHAINEDTSLFKPINMEFDF